ncbi:pentatricopeptide repeat-containing protein At1g62350-like isoform X2 [Olea europaea var. sylvestris]|uniref:pentatricopeptide repeat-containing protein At1g62350-like isoform X2 n=1 Tax=Olea europaea var. sylvestris TaxID=158386 RepID=UPI000C1D6361|nr:pentatricopeptide repeat-containing protein At1g62350-like isoform X2 [Olea europaea var. sylvestris]
MGTFKLEPSHMGIRQNLQISATNFTPRTLRISCGLRSGPRKPMWRTRVLSTEAIQAVQSLKLAQKSPSRLEQVFSNKLSRLLKADLLDVLAELQRQNESDLALKVFNFVRKELWYEPDLTLFNDMLMMVGRNKMIEIAEQLLLELRNESLEPDARSYTEMIGAYFKVEMVKKAMDTYELMKASGCAPDKLTLTILIRNLEKAGEGALAAVLKKECTEYVEYPEKFLEEVERTHPKRRSLRLV